MFDKTALVTEKALTEGQIGVAYKGSALEGKDSGWRFLHSMDESPLDTSNPDKVYVCSMKKLEKYFPYIRELKGKGNYCRRGSAWEAVGELPSNCRLPRKTRMNDGMVGALDGKMAILTIDPEEMRQLKKKGMERRGEGSECLKTGGLTHCPL